MPGRRKPASAKQRKAELQLKRAIKRGDAPPQEPKKLDRKQKGRMNQIGQRLNPGDAGITSKHLQSSFVKVSPWFLEETKLLASTLTLPRPIDVECTIFPDLVQGNSNTIKTLVCPIRPKWRFDMSKTEVEKNEEGLFKKWIAQTDQSVAEWQKSREQPLPVEEGDLQTRTMPPSPTHFERNIQVWRQLWRVTEISQIILVLLDSRCPLLHYPPALANYLAGRKIILVLTKVDISGPARANAWIAYLEKHYPTLRVIQVESYAEKETSDQQGRKMYEPHLPTSFRERLVQVLKEAHAELLVPPDYIRKNEAKLRNWKPPVRQVVDWENVLKADCGQAGTVVRGAAVPRPKSDDSEGDAEEPGYLTVGLIGQPNVGKSSLLNALFGARKVRASKTPGKTKHFQTLFRTPDVRLVDCPGLVIPNFVPMETQVLSGILPISRVSAVPACIYYASMLAPLEIVFGLTHPRQNEPLSEDRRTWRGDQKAAGSSKPLSWTAMDILTAYANLKGWVTAKAGRPDIHRAGNAILRGMAEGKVAWAFWPPGSEPSSVAQRTEPGLGICVSNFLDERERDDEDQFSDENTEAGDEDPELDEDSDEDSDESADDDAVTFASVGRFSILSNFEVGDVDDDVDDEDEDGDDEKVGDGKKGFGLGDLNFKIG